MTDPSDQTDGGGGVHSNTESDWLDGDEARALTVIMRLHTFYWEQEIG